STARRTRSSAAGPCTAAPPRGSARRRTPGCRGGCPPTSRAAASRRRGRRGRRGRTTRGSAAAGGGAGAAQGGCAGRRRPPSSCGAPFPSPPDHAGPREAALVVPRLPREQDGGDGGGRPVDVLVDRDVTPSVRGDGLRVDPRDQPADGGGLGAVRVVDPELR